MRLFFSCQPLSEVSPPGSYYPAATLISDTLLISSPPAGGGNVLFALAPGVLIPLLPPAGVVLALAYGSLLIGCEVLCPLPVAGRSERLDPPLRVFLVSGVV